MEQVYRVCTGVYARTRTRKFIESCVDIVFTVPSATNEDEAAS